MDISIFGMGYVGAVSLACLARDGHKVIGVDLDKVKLKLIASGQSPIIEEGMPELVRDVVKNGNIETSTEAEYAIRGSEVSFVCVGTPSSLDGSQDLTAIRRVTEQIGVALRNVEHYHVIVYRSTIQPGTIENIVKPILKETSGRELGVNYGICFQPEFLREGSSIKDYDNPPYTIVGGDSEKSISKLKQLFEHLPNEFYSTDIGTAEMLKIVCNNFHALKATFANEVGRVCQSLNIDSQAVMDLVCMDKHLNISTAYMKPGFAFGGSCLPKDLRALLHIAKTNNVNIPMLSGLLPSNSIHIEHSINMVLQLNKKKIGMIGLSFKTGTDDLRESPLVELAERFIGKGLNLRIYDPEVNISRLMGANRKYIEEVIPHIASLMCDNIDEVFTESEVIIVGLNNRELLDSVYKLSRPEHQIIDLVNLPDQSKLRSQYKGVCW